MRGTPIQGGSETKAIIFAYLSIEKIFSHLPRLKIYITSGRRVVMPDNLPSGVIAMVRDAKGNEINNPSTEPRPVATAGGPMSSRDEHLRERRPMGTNVGGQGLPTETRFIENKYGKSKKLMSGFHDSIYRYCQGTSEQQECERQMCRGAYKTEKCTHFRCDKHQRGTCCFMHAEEDDDNIDEIAMRVRYRIFTQMSDDGCSLPAEHRLEIGEITEQELDNHNRAKYYHEQYVLEEEAKGKGKSKGKCKDKGT